VGTPKAIAINRWPRLLWRIFVFTLLLVVLVLLSGYATISYAHHKAQKLLLEVRTLEPGKTTVEDVKNLAKRFGGEEYDARSYYAYVESDKKYLSPDPCLGEALSYSIAASPPLTLLRAIQEFPTLQKLGLHPWYVSVAIHHKDGKVTCYSQNVWFFRSDGQQVQASANLELRNPQNLAERKPYEADSFVSRNLYHKTRVDVLPEASVEEKTRAFQMDLSCTVSLRGCSFPCQIIPLGWLDSVRDRQSHGRELPEGANDPRCPAHRAFQ
jgi:hypothetical protein